MNKLTIFSILLIHTVSLYNMEKQHHSNHEDNIEKTLTENKNFMVQICTKMHNLNQYDENSNKLLVKEIEGYLTIKNKASTQKKACFK